MLTLPQFIIIFLTTSPSSPFLDIPSPQLPVDPLRPLTSPLPDRSWITWNNGSVWDPAIMGYREIATVYRDEQRLLDAAANQTTSSELSPSEELQAAPSEVEAARSWWSSGSWRKSAVSTPSTPSDAPIPSPSTPSSVVSSPEPTSRDTDHVPSNYVDLRWGGIGFVLDLGFSRTEEGMGWELADAKRAVAARVGQYGQGAMGSGELEVSGDKPRRGVQNATTEGGTSGDGRKATNEKPWSMWDNVAFLGRW